MSGLASIADRWLQWVWSLSWQVALLVGIVTISCWLLRARSPRLRHALWLLVLVKVLLPPTLAAPWSLGTLMPANVDHLTERVTLMGTAGEEIVAGAEIGTAPLTDRSRSSGIEPLAPIVWLMLTWLAGAMLFYGVVIWRSVHLRRGVEQLTAADEGPLRIELERLSQQLGIARIPDLRIADRPTSPFLMGVWNPVIVLPQSLASELDERDLRTVLLHELLHWRRRDTWIGCLQVLVQGLMWFHPLVWWASSQLRSERENVIDDAVVREGAIPAQSYGETILRVLTATRARCTVAGTLVGVFERGAKLQQRLENVMSYETGKRNFGVPSWLFLIVFALLFVPMGLQKVSDTSAAAAESQADEAKATPKKRTTYPVIVETSPESGATDVPTSLGEIKVTFDRDMSGGMSWTGGPPLMPPIDTGREARWIDKRTCVLPVKLERGAFYRVGINSSSHQNFKSAAGQATPPTAIFFVTEGANKAVQNRVRVPKIVTLEPANNAEAVPVSISAVTVTFDMPMGEGMSWTGGGESFPEPAGQATWSNDGKTCTLPVKLKPNHAYRLGLNSLSHNNFQSKWGVPLEPVVYKFRMAEK